ncbi:MAG TPA: hypothetical protein VMI32_11660 [Candidatus Solibacter sp.]|nr:hypothetical protein [Candidatus Solibacter sp.]
MGNRDKRGREKKKPKKDVKVAYQPARPTTVYKPAPTPATPPTQPSTPGDQKS